MLRYIALALAGLLWALPAYAHFFGATKDVDGFQVVFQPFPAAPIVGTNSTFNFSVLYNGSNVYKVYRQSQSPRKTARWFSRIRIGCTR